MLWALYCISRQNSLFLSLKLNKITESHWKIIQSFYVTTLDSEYLVDVDANVSQGEASMLAFANVVPEEKYKTYKIFIN